MMMRITMIMLMMTKTNDDNACRKEVWGWSKRHSFFRHAVSAPQVAPDQHYHDQHDQPDQHYIMIRVGSSACSIHFLNLKWLSWLRSWLLMMMMLEMMMTTIKIIIIILMNHIGHLPPNIWIFCISKALRMIFLIFWPSPSMAWPSMVLPDVHILPLNTFPYLHTIITFRQFISWKAAIIISKLNPSTCNHE